ncbi:MAG: metallophosphoesterase [bacterium]
MGRIAYVTDLHLGAPETRVRLGSFGNKINKLPAHTAAVCLTSDTFTLVGGPIWNPMIARPLTENEVKERGKISWEVVDQWMKPLLASIPKGLPVYIVPGNADFLAYVQLAGLGVASGPFQCLDGKVSDVNSLYLLGAGAITPNDENASRILQYNPWYGGIISAEAFKLVLGDLLTATNSWQPNEWASAVLMTHMPAFGHVDQFKGQSQGSSDVLNFIRTQKPLLHLAGHVHDGPFAGGEYLPWSIVNRFTISLNAGGGQQHDSEQGVRLLSIDVDALVEGRRIGRLEQAAEEAIVSL